MHRRNSTGPILISLFALTLLTYTGFAASAYQGFVFCASGQNAYLLNPSGTTVHTWKASGSARSCAYLLPDGSALFPIQTNCTVRGDGAYPHGRLQKISWDGEILWDAVVCDNTYTPGYDLEPMPNGNVIVGGASSSGAFKIVEVKPSGTSGHENVWTYDLSISSGGGMTRINSISYNPDLGDSGYILLSLNEANPCRLLVIDKAKKSIVYTHNVTTGSLIHGAIWANKYFIGTDIVMPDADATAMKLNNILTVNNSVQVVEANPITQAFVKNIPFSFSSHEGSVQRLPNGNLLVATQSNTATEIDDDGKTIRTIRLPGNVARAYMYGPSYPGLKSYAMTERIVSTPTKNSVGGLTYNVATNTGIITLAHATDGMSALRIYSPAGKTVYAASVQGHEARFSTRNLVRGVYYVTFRNGPNMVKTSFFKM